MENFPDPLPQTHAHNDYEHKSPLFDALSNGFTSIEADVAFKDGEMRVTHNPYFTTPGRTLQKLYLDPLKKLIEKNHGHVYPNSAQALTLLIDIKSGSAETYRELEKIFAGYDSILTSYQGDKVENGPLEIIFSGNTRPVEKLKGNEKRYGVLDGRPWDIRHKYKACYMSMISANWNNQFSWHGDDGPMPAEQYQRLVEFVRAVHANGQKARFWGTPEKDPVAREAVWDVLYEANVDEINTDHLPELRAYLLKKQMSLFVNKKPAYASVPEFN